MDSEQKQSKVTIEAKSARQAALEVCDFVVEEEEDDEDSDYDKNADDSRENDVRNVSNNQMEDENLDEGDGDDVLNEEKSRESSFDHDEDKRECAAPKNAQYAFGSPERIDDEDEYGDDDFDDDFEKSDNEDEQHESSKPYHSGSSPLTHEPANLEESTGGDVDDIHSIEEEDDISVGQVILLILLLFLSRCN